jgi:hypothetical protein
MGLCLSLRHLDAIGGGACVQKKRDWPIDFEDVIRAGNFEE